VNVLENTLSLIAELVETKIATDDLLFVDLLQFESVAQH
jgi:hypothetical protein